MNPLIAAARILLAALREIFDEAAYTRFLAGSHMPSSPEAYAAFWCEREKRPVPPKCC